MRMVVCAITCECIQQESSFIYMHVFASLRHAEEATLIANRLLPRAVQNVTAVSRPDGAALHFLDKVSAERCGHGARARAPCDPGSLGAAGGG